MSKFNIRIELTDGQWHYYNANQFIVVDSKLEVIIDKSVISYDFDLIESLSIVNQEED